MVPFKIPALVKAAMVTSRAANDSFMPVPPKPRRYGRAALWADRRGLSEPDFGKLSLMRAMERKNRG